MMLAYREPEDQMYPPASSSSPAQAAADLADGLGRHGITGIYTAAAQTHAVVSVIAELTVWTDGQRLWCTHQGRRHSWPVADIGTAVARLAALATAMPDDADLASASLCRAQ